jgi:acetate---CoA ligase (ADP-forming) subunit beta
MRTCMPTRILPELEAKELLGKWEIDVVDTRLAASAEEAVALAEKLGYPVVLKILSPDITHKSDVGGVRLDLRTPQHVRESYDSVLSSARRACLGAAIGGVSVQRMAPKGIELIIGMSTDPTFGPMMMFGIGGIFVEILKDVAFRIVPLSERDAHAMIREIRGFPLLNGFRGQEPVDVPYLEGLLLKVSRLVEANPEIEELDINPVIAYANGAVVVDARIILQDS